MNESCLSISGTKDTETKITKKEKKKWRWGLGPIVYPTQLPHGIKGGKLGKVWYKRTVTDSENRNEEAPSIN